MTLSSSSSSSEASNDDDDSSSSSWELEHFEERSRKVNDTDSMIPKLETETVPPDQERQLLLLMLLAQVCALHDPTPRTFTVHVLELFERGILDRQSIHFLFELGLVPSSQRRLLGSSPELALVSEPIQQRSMEASAIRTSLEHLDSTTRQKQYVRYTSSWSDPGPQSWTAESHPLSLSRYQREFRQVGLLASGAFGQVFHVTSKMDGFDYAIKRIAFSAKGYSKESVQQVVREVQCLAVCDHPNVVRYYTSWLEPSWMTGSGRRDDATDDDDDTRRHNLLLGLHDVVNGKKESDSLSEGLQDYFKDPSLGRRSDQRRFSFDDSYDASTWELHHEEETASIWDAEDDLFVRDDSFVSSAPPKRGTPAAKKNDYSYQICLFIQMQLCHPKTLADWIRLRNQERQSDSVQDRIEVAAQVFDQIVAGLCHVHGKGIVHRDLKPANIFTSVEDGLIFKIGDFGLSKLIQTASRQGTLSTRRSFLMLDHESELRQETDDTLASKFVLDWNDPHTAGVGTASYAAPEQVSSREYGTKADVFSLGLILLELLCSFSTEHERLLTFRDCRQGRKLPTELSKYKVASEIILSCTNSNPDLRPSAAELLGRDIRPARKTADDLAGLLEKTLADQRKEIERCHEEMAKKDRIIAELSAQLARVSAENTQ
ncbi:eukaryotic translation initiation factor 2-alpha kinase 1 [Fistulifera solaris]|uniref:non-specific serine/threonine protein kinase n=1 Tax=Fistulifera solaris TaxID=1519565 RepID=A0A1Z5K296_FISSO|nr:eukaryotic translation initiation factor 2-alpha kinase 1 [Fistulifera solaris]|eukprot:GAX20246.1 eukaryotic translation initiation factor 2-alpha kinase 1 [Fistulifera solaris]